MLSINSWNSVALIQCRNCTLSDTTFEWALLADFKSLMSVSTSSLPIKCQCIADPARISIFSKRANVFSMRSRKKLRQLLGRNATFLRTSWVAVFGTQAKSKRTSFSRFRVFRRARASVVSEDSSSCPFSAETWQVFPCRNWTTLTCDNEVCSEETSSTTTQKWSAQFVKLIWQEAERTGTAFKFSTSILSSSADSSACRESPKPNLVRGNVFSANVRETCSQANTESSSCKSIRVSSLEGLIESSGHPWRFKHKVSSFA